MGAPPFGSFVSEWLLLSKATDESRWGIVIALAVGLAISFVAVLIHLGRVVFGDKPDRNPRSHGSMAPAIVMLAVSAALFVSISPGALEFLRTALQAGGSR